MMDIPVPEASAIGVVDAALAALERLDLPAACRHALAWCATVRTTLADAPWWLFHGRVDDLAELVARLFAAGERELARDVLLASAVFFTHASGRQVERVRPVLEGDAASIVRFVERSGGPGVTLEAFGVKREDVGDAALTLLDAPDATPETIVRALSNVDDRGKRVLLGAALRRWPASPVLWRIAAGALLVARRHRDAATAYARALAPDATPPDGLVGALEGLPRIDLHGSDRAGDSDEPAEGLDRASTSEAPLVNLAILFRHLDGTTAARAAIERFVTTAPPADVARARFELGDVEGAVQWLLDHDPAGGSGRRVTSALDAARILLAAGRPVDALGLLRAVGAGYLTPTDWLQSLQGPYEPAVPSRVRRLRRERSLGPWTRIIIPVDPAAVAQAALDALLREHDADTARAAEAERLVDDLSSRDDDVRSAALLGLERLGPAVTRVVASRREDAMPMVRRVLDGLVSTWMWDAAAARIRAVFRVPVCTEDKAAPLHQMPEGTLAARLAEACDAVTHLRMDRAARLAGEILAACGAAGPHVIVPPNLLVDLAEALVLDGRPEPAHRLLVAAAPRISVHDRPLRARCRALLADAPIPALEFLLRTGDTPVLGMVGLTADATIDACVTLLDAGTIALGDVTRLAGSLRPRARLRLLQASVPYFPTSTALLGILALTLLDDGQFDLARAFLESCLEARLARRSEPLDADATADEAWWTARPTDGEACPVLIREGVDADGAVRVRAADPPQGAARAGSHQPVLEIVAIIRQEQRGDAAAAEAIERFAELEHPRAVVRACRAIGRPELAVEHLERRTATASIRDHDLLAALAEAYLDAGRHMDALLVPRVFMRAGHAARAALATLVYGDGGDVLEELEREFPTPFTGGSPHPRLDEAVAQRQVLDLLCGGPPPPAEVAERARDLVRRLAAADEAEMVDVGASLQGLGAAIAPVVIEESATLDSAVRERLERLVVALGWQVAEERFAARFPAIDRA